MKHISEENLTAVISVIRHGEKNAEGLLTDEGKRQAKQRGIQMPHLKGDVILFHSGVGRVKDTIHAIGAHLHLNTNDDLEKELEEQRDLQTYTVPKLHYLFDAKQKGDLFSHWDDEGQNETVRMQEFLAHDKKSTEPTIYPAPYVIARRLLDVIQTQIHFALLTLPEQRTNFINGTHEPVIMSFLRYVIIGSAPDSFVSDIGGSVQFAEGFDLFVYQNDDASLKKIIFIFRDTVIEYNDVSELQF